MEFSSPLAAMAPPPCPRAFGCGRQAAASRSLGPNSFNFRDLSMKRAQPDYFSLKAGTIAGSSPAAVLAADLSQNFHIDKSPQLPTPRRSLFTSGIFGASAAREGATTPPVRWEGVTTPPVPSSSPGFGSDPMELSPLPHKPPFFRLQVQLPACSQPAPTPDEDMVSSSEVLFNAFANTKPASQPAERKPFARPSLSRTKCFSTTTITQQRLGPDHQLPPFTFGAGGNGVNTSSGITTLEECFQESPQQDRTATTSVFLPPRPRLPLYNNGNMPVRRSGSPNHSAPKKAVEPFTRPRKLFRRSLSMFEHPADVMKEEKKEYQPSGLQSIMDVDDAHELKLPHFIPTDAPCSLPRINQETLVRVIEGDFRSHYDHVVMIDCRFEYEYNGGHIDGAVNYNDKEHLARELFGAMPSKSTLLIFHCEFSQQRAPLMAQHIRKHDRTYNTANYPRLSYPEVYILDGGYSAFFKLHRSRCFPQNYVEMEDEKHEQAMERGLGKMKQRKPLQRSVTYAFGQGICQSQNSPSRPASSIGGSLFQMDLGGALAPFCATRAPARRMASY